jgi:GT2 family glycosyltransferase
MKFADIIIPHHNQHKMLAECLERLDNKLFNIIIISGGTFAENCNKGAKLAETEDLIFLNDDTLPTNEAMLDLATAEDDITGIAQKIGSVVYYGIKAGTTATTYCLTTKREEVSIPSGFCFKIKKKVWQDLKGFDERYKNGAEDLDLFLRAKVKFGLIETPIIHHHSQSEGRHKFEKENYALFDQTYQ